MKVEIWSDIMCPFCYIGKRKFEQALENFPHKDSAEITWKSFQLQPDLVSVEGKNINQYLAEIKGVSLQQATEMNAYVGNMAKEVGLDYDFDNMKVANTLDAHRVIHLAAKHNLQSEAKERILKAYFTEGTDISNHDELARLGTEIGLNSTEIKEMLASDDLKYDVKADIQEAANLGLQGVPFFVFNRKYGVSGAQPAEIFSQTLEKVWEEEGK